MYIDRKILFAMNCKLCKKEFVYCVRAGSDFRCYDCKKQNRYDTVESINFELENMEKEEIESFLKDIEDHEKEILKKIKKL